MKAKTKNKQKKAIKLLENQGLLLATSPKQKENQTLYFVDPKTMVGYSITKNGYCYRHIFKAGYYNDEKLQYQLNPRNRENGTVTAPGKYVKLAKALLNPIAKYRGEKIEK